MLAPAPHRSTTLLLLALPLAALITTTLSPPGAHSAVRGNQAKAGTQAKPLERAEPTYPSRGVPRGQEGWVTLSYVVATDGSTKDVVVQRSSGVREFERAARRAVKKWRFVAATQGSALVEQSHSDVYLRFVVSGKGGAQAGFKGAYEEINQLIQGDKLAEAETAIEALQAKRGLNLYEVSRVWVLRALLASRGGDRELELVYLSRALAPAGDAWLEPAATRVLLLRKFELEAHGKHFSAALQTLAQLRKLAPEQELPASVLEVAEQIGGLREKSDSFSVSGAIAQAAGGPSTLGVWHHTPMHRQIGFNTLAGSIDHFELRCTWQHFSGTPEPRKVWTMPQSWGICSVFVFAKPGTSFELIEYGPGALPDS